MSALYPKMRERPEYFRINRNSPLWDGLVFAGLGGQGCVGSTRFADSGPYGTHGTLINMDPRTHWVWDKTLRRWTTYYDKTAIKCVEFGRIERWFFDNKNFTVAIWKYATSSYSDTTRIFLQHEAVNPPYTGWTIQYYAGYFWFLNTTWTLAQPTNTWYCIVGVLRRGATIESFVNGALIASNADPGGINLACNRKARLGNFDPGYAYQNFTGFLADPLLWERDLTSSEIAAIADPSNVDLRVGGVPLILPPKRKFFEVAVVPKHKYWSKRPPVGAGMGY